MEFIASMELFIALVGAGIIGAVVVGIIIIVYTVLEFRRKEIW